MLRGWSVMVGILFCVGGRGTSGTPFKTIECYDARKNSWTQVVEMSTRRRHVGVVAVAGVSVCLSVCLSLSLCVCVCVRVCVCVAARGYIGEGDPAGSQIRHLFFEIHYV